MFCYQCEQTAHGTACVTTGLCGKDGDTAALQDLLVYAAQGISQYAHRAAALGARSADIDHFVADALFTTVTNVSFDPARLEGQIRQAVAIRDKAAVLYAEAARAAGQEPEKLSGPAAWVPAADLVAQGQEVTIQGRIASEGADITGLKEMLVYGVKGAAAYACHARVLGQEDPVVYAFFHEALDVALREGLTAEDLLGLNLRCGEISLRVMELLDAANTGTYGHPVPTPVLMGHKKGKAILVSGHDLKDLEELLKQTEGKGINIYTHGEMLPAHGYPNLKKYPHLAGHFGGAWQKQRQEFRDFPGSILMTTNCIQNPHEDYAGRLFTSGLVAWPGIPHIANHDYTPVINAALAAEGFQDDSAEKFHTVGFGHNAVLGVADVVIDAVKSGALKRFMLIGGCDGSEGSRSYYTDMAEQAPKDWAILTLGCGKFRLLDSDLGSLGPLPRLLDMGQCNDAFSAIKVAGALASAFNCGVNDLPLSLVISWFEQKAVCVLQALLFLGVKNIRLGPNLPAFVTPPVLKVLVETFNVMPIGTAEADLKVIAA